MKMLIVTTLFAAVSLFADELIRWNTPETLGKWKAQSNVKCELKDNVLVLTEIKPDCQLICTGLKIDTSKFDSISFRYRAEGSPENHGEIFYAHENGRFVGTDYWRIPALTADGKWHTMELTKKNLRTPASWFEGGVVTKLRFDPTNAAGGKIEITDIKIYFNPKQPAKKQLTIREKLPSDEPVWPAVKPELRTFRHDRKGEASFQGKMIRSPEDLRGTGKHKAFLLRKEFVLKEKPVLAWIQFTADDRAEAFINGQYVLRCDDWRSFVFAEVSAGLNKGKNVWAFRYENIQTEGGVMGELFVRYPDGTSEKFHTDSSFRAHTEAKPNWNKAGFAADSWKKIIEQNGPPNAPWTCRVRYRNFEFPQKFIKAAASPVKADAGKKIVLEYTFQGKIPVLPFSGRLVMRKGGKMVWEEPFTLTEKQIRKEKENWTCSFEFTMPRYLSGGKLNVRMESGSLFCSKGGYPETELVLQGLAKDELFPQSPVVRRENSGYGPHVVINGKAQYLLWGAVQQNARPDKVPRFGDAPLNAVTVYTRCNEFWPSCGVTDFSSFDRQAELYHRQNPDAWFIWDLTIFPPAEWAKKYPDEMCHDEKGEIVKDGRLCYSFASKKALKDMMEVMEKAIRYVEKSPYANRVIAYRINSGHTIEWLGWDPKRGVATDFSPAAKKAFREFAKKNYPELKDFSIPTLKQRQTEGDLLWDPQKHLNVIAYHDFYSQAPANMIIALCSRAKELVTHKKLVGTYYGYCATLHTPGNSQMRAHYALKKVLDSKAVDFLMSPQSYKVRNIGGTCSDMKPFGTLRNAGLLPVIEDDTRTHNGPWFARSSCYQTVTEKQSLAVLRRNMGITLCRNEICYHYALCTGTELDFPAAAQDMGLVRKTGEFCLKKQVRRNAEIAIVISEKSILSMPMLRQGEYTGWRQRYLPDGKVQRERTGGRFLTDETFMGNIQRLARTGAPVDYLLAEDMKDHPGKYKLYIFLNCYTFDKNFLAAIEQLKQQNCTLLWLYAPGYEFEGKIGEGNMKKLTGITLKKESVPVSPSVVLKNGARLDRTRAKITPIFYADDPEAEILGTNDLGHAGMAAKRTGKARSIFSSAYRLEIPFLQNLMKECGIHLYSGSTDPMEANSALVTLHARTSGRKTIRLPRKTNVVDVFNRTMVAQNADNFTFDSPLHSSWLFYYGDDAAELLKELKGK